jgi:hypothetical protein
MVLQLIKDKLGNYIYKDAMEASKPPVTSQEFEAYTGGSKTTLAGTTDLGTQTQALMRETPGQTKLVTDPVTGETKAESDIQSVAVQQKNFAPPTTQELIESPLQKAARIAQQFPMQQQTGASPQEFLGQIQSMQDKAIKAERMNTILKGGVDLGISYLNMGRTIPGTTGPITPLTSLTATPVGASTLGGVGLAGGAGYMVSRALGGDEKESTAAGAGAAIGTAVGGPVGGVVGGVIGKVVGGRVICNELCRQGLLPKEDVILDLKFTRDYLTDTHAHGYWLYAVPSVKLMRKSKLATKVWHHIAKNRLDDVKWRLGKGKFNLLGRVYSIILENLSYGLGKLFPNTTYEELYT